MYRYIVTRLLLAIPTLAGSAAYAFAETLGWRQGLDKKLKQARAFYTLILLSTGVGVGLDFVGINPVKALYWTAVINGLLAPFLLVGILVVASDKKLMQGQPSSRLGWTIVAITTTIWPPTRARGAPRRDARPDQCAPHHAGRCRNASACPRPYVFQRRIICRHPCTKAAERVKQVDA